MNNISGEQFGSEIEDNNSSIMEKRSELVEKAASLSIFLHGNSSGEDVTSIKESGLKATLGRASFSGNLTHAYSWATEMGRRQSYSKSETTIISNEPGSIVILKVPAEMQTGLGTYTGIEVDEEQRIIRGDSLKYMAGLKQLGIYPAGDINAMRVQLEEEKKKLGEMRNNTSGIGDEELAVQIEHQDEKANPAVRIDKENVISTINPIPEFKNFLMYLDGQIKSFQLVDLKMSARQLTAFSGLGAEATETIILSTIESIVVSKIRNLIIKTKKLQGYKIFNKEEDITENLPGGNADITEELKKISEVLPDYTQIDARLTWLNDYVRSNIEYLNEEIKKIP